LPFLLPLNLFLPCDRFAGVTPLQFLARQRYKLAYKKTDIID